MRDHAPAVILLAALIVSLAPGCSLLSDSADEDPPSDGSSTLYTVEKGDTLWSIAKEAYGEGRHYRRILEANPHLEPARLRVGQRLVLPAPN